MASLWTVDPSRRRLRDGSPKCTTTRIVSRRRSSGDARPGSAQAAYAPHRNSASASDEFRRHPNGDHRGTWLADGEFTTVGSIQELANSGEPSTRSPESLRACHAPRRNSATTTAEEPVSRLRPATPTPVGRSGTGPHVQCAGPATRQHLRPRRPVRDRHRKVQLRDRRGDLRPRRTLRLEPHAPNDRLRGRFGAQTPFRLVRHDSAITREHLVAGYDRRRPSPAITMEHLLNMLPHAPHRDRTALIRAPTPTTATSPRPSTNSSTPGSLPSSELQ